MFIILLNNLILLLLKKTEFDISKELLLLVLWFELDSLLESLLILLLSLA